MSIYQHFRKHEHPFVDQVLSWKEQVERTYSYYLTDFLDPREQQIVTTLIGTTNEEIQFSFFGGGNHTERKRAIIAPYYEDIRDQNFDLTLLEGSFPERFVKIQHRDILGAFMSLGIDRKKIGDIIVTDDMFQLVITSELAPYIMMNFTKVNNVHIELKERPKSRILEKKDEWVHQHHTVSSLRLDVVVKEIYQMSRKDAVHYIKGNRVKVNFTDIDDPSVPLLAHDLLSVRGHGRSKLVEIKGKTRKDKFRIMTARLKA